jgi:hypothetical protein
LSCGPQRLEGEGGEAKVNVDADNDPEVRWRTFWRKINPV